MSNTAKATYFWRAAFHGFLRSPFIHSVAIVTIAVSLFGAGLTQGLVRWVDSLVASLDAGAEMTVYLKDDASTEIRDAVLGAIRQRGGDGKLVSPETALKGVAAELNQYRELLLKLPRNPLPWTVEAHFSHSGRNPAALRILADELKRARGVDDVDYGEKSLERLSAISKALRFGGVVAFFVVLLMTVVIVSATLQLAIYRRREEVEIQRLVGASNSFVRAPFLIEGLMQGLIGALLASAALWSFAVFASPRLSSLFSFLSGSPGSFRIVEPATILELVAGGAALGFGGSVIAVSRFLRV